MPEQKKKIILTGLGVFFVIFGIGAMDYAIYHSHPDWILFICYLGLVIMGIGILINHPELVASQLNILTVPLLIWLADFSYVFFSRQSLWGTTDYFFASAYPLARLISLEHFFILPLGFYALYLLKLKKNYSIIFSLVYLPIIFVLTRFFTNPVYNINCAFRSCVSFIPTTSWYILTWFAVIVPLTFIVYLATLLISAFKQKI